MTELEIILDQIRRRDRGKHTRLKMLKAILVLGPKFHTGDEIRKAYKRSFLGENFDFLYLEPLVYSYGLVTIKEKIRKSHFQRLAKISLFRIRQEFYDDLKRMLFDQKGNISGNG